jgi:hypothetical protein
MNATVVIFAGALLATAAASAQDPQKTADVLTGDANGSAANNPICKLFTTAEVAKYVGKPVGAGENAALGSGCQWVATDDEGDLLVQVVEARYHTVPSQAKGFQSLPDVGTQAFVVPELGGWKAATLRGTESIIVSVSSPTANAQTATALLKDTLGRRM